MAPEEFAATIALVNRLLERDLPRDFGWCLFGYACCACTAGLALGPGLYLRRQVRARISLIDCHVRILNDVNALGRGRLQTVKGLQAILDSENARVYHKVPPPNAQTRGVHAHPPLACPVRLDTHPNPPALLTSRAFALRITAQHPLGACARHDTDASRICTCLHRPSPCLKRMRGLNSLCAVIMKPGSSDQLRLPSGAGAVRNGSAAHATVTRFFVQKQVQGGIRGNRYIGQGGGQGDVRFCTDDHGGLPPPPPP